MRIFTLLLLTIGLSASACTPTNESTDGPGNDDMIEATGTIRYIDLEGGFYGIVADDGTQYDPSGLPDGFQEDGLRVAFRAELQEDVLTTRMWGQVVRLIDIERL